MKLMIYSCVVFCMALGLTTPLWATTYAYIPNQSSGTDSVTRVTTSTETAVTFELTGTAIDGEPYGAAVMPDGSYVLVTLSNDNALVKITNSNFASSTVMQAPLSLGVDCTQPRGVAIDSDGVYAYVANYESDNVAKIVLSTFTLDSDTNWPLDVGDGPWGIATFYDENEDANIIYVANHNADTISVITDDDETTPHVDTITGFGDGPVGLALTPDGRYLYVANLNSSSVAVIRTSDNSVIETISVGADPDQEAGPWGVAVGSDGRYVYVTNSLDSPAGTVSIISTSTQAVYATRDVGNGPMGVAAPKNGDFAYVVNQTDKTISVVRAEDDTVDTIEDTGIDGSFALGAFIGGSKPVAPSGLKALAESHGTIKLTWNDNSNDELGFKIERREKNDDDYVQIDTVGEEVTSYTDEGLNDNTTYYYRIRSYNEAADSSYATEASDKTDEGDFSWCFIGVLLR